MQHHRYSSNPCERNFGYRAKNEKLNKFYIHVVCHQLKAAATKQLMGELPSSRIQPLRPFKRAGIDYAEPVSIRLGSARSKTIVKAYIAVFVCFATKAVHLEMVTSLTTDAFLAALRRFAAKRGKPSHLYSDNGTNFVGAAHHLQ
jgi:hypothetical protein